MKKFLQSLPQVLVNLCGSYTCTVLLYNDDELAGSCAVAFIKASGKWYAAATVEYAVE